MDTDDIVDTDSTAGLLGVAMPVVILRHNTFRLYEPIDFFSEEFGIELIELFPEGFAGDDVNVLIR